MPAGRQHCGIVFAGVRRHRRRGCRSAEDCQSWFPQQFGANQIYTRDERVDGRIALQWQPSDNMVLTLDDNYSQQKIKADNFGFGMWFNQSGLRNVQLDCNGTIVDFGQSGSQTDFTAGTDRTYYRTNQTGLNLKWDVSDKLSSRRRCQLRQELAQPRWPRQQRQRRRRLWL